MIRGHINQIEQANNGVLIRMRVYYPNYPDQPHHEDYATEEQFEEAKMNFDLKKRMYEKEKREIDMLRLGMVNLFQDGEVE